MGYRPKRPSELLAMISAQYETPELDRNGQPRNSDRGRKKTKIFFQVSVCNDS
jgi:hypothetical protein